MLRQSTHHLMMIEPVGFCANQQTIGTNAYQASDQEQGLDIGLTARDEFRRLRDMLIENGVIVTSVKGSHASPDDVFCNNWASTHQDGRMMLYPVMAENRRLERRPDLIEWLKRRYSVALDMTEMEQQERYLESTGALALDRVHKIAYCALSARADQETAQEWATRSDYKLVAFHTRGHDGKAIYHTNVMMFIGTGYAGICLDCIVSADRDRVEAALRATHEIIPLEMTQLLKFCGNALEVGTTGGDKLLAMSDSAYHGFLQDQHDIVLRHGVRPVHSPIPTIEKYGGGSVRCMLFELF